MAQEPITIQYSDEFKTGVERLIIPLVEKMYEGGNESRGRLGAPPLQDMPWVELTRQDLKTGGVENVGYVLDAFVPDQKEMLRASHVAAALKDATGPGVEAFRAEVDQTVALQSVVSKVQQLEGTRRSVDEKVTYPPELRENIERLFAPRAEEAGAGAALRGALESGNAEQMLKVLRPLTPPQPTLDQFMAATEGATGEKVEAMRQTLTDLPAMQALQGEMHEKIQASLRRRDEVYRHERERQADLDDLRKAHAGDEPQRQSRRGRVSDYGDGPEMVTAKGEELQRGPKVWAAARPAVNFAGKEDERGTGGGMGGPD